MAFVLLAGNNFNLLFVDAAEYLIIPSASMKDLPKGKANFNTAYRKVIKRSLSLSTP